MTDISQAILNAKKHLKEIEILASRKNADIEKLTTEWEKLLDEVVHMGVLIKDGNQ